jgi:hypothetical protein
VRTINRRVGKLEQGLGVTPSAQDLRNWELAETIRRRRAERLGEPYLPGVREEGAKRRSSFAETLRSARIRMTSVGPTANLPKRRTTDFTCEGVDDSRDETGRA